MTAAEAGAGSCPRCGEPYEPLQEYCLDCGLRLPLPRGPVVALGATWRRRLRWYPGDWIWPALALLALAVLGGVAAFLAARPSHGVTTVVATQGARPAPAALGGTAGGELASWPTGKAGYTAVLQSFPTSGGKAGATALARKAASVGLRDTGILRSSKFASLHEGYFVVFSGIYTSLPAARNAAAAAVSKGFPGAYAQRIAP